MCARQKLANIREIEVLCNQEAPLSSCCQPDSRVVLPSKRLVRHRVGVVAILAELLCQSIWHVFVKLYLHAIDNCAGNGMSSSAEAAAKAMTART